MSNVTDALTALADPTRRSLLERLSIRGEATATTLAGNLPISRQAVVQHLTALDKVGLVRGRRQGREHRFIVCSEPLAETIKWMETLSKQWDRRLSIIKEIAEAPQVFGPDTIANPNFEDGENNA